MIVLSGMAASVSSVQENVPSTLLSLKVKSLFIRISAKVLPSLWTAE